MDKELVQAHWDNVADLWEEAAEAWEKASDSVEELRQYYGQDVDSSQ